MNNIIKKDLKKYNVIFGGTCKNVEKYIEKILKYIDECGKKFNEYYVIIYENDSTDFTKDILLKNKKDNYKYIFETDNDYRRTVRLARGRNMIVDEVRNININNKYDYLIMLDLDDVNKDGTFVETIETNFNYDDWDVMCGNQKDKYYDMWALRKKDIFNFDMWKQINTTGDYQKYYNLRDNFVETLSKTELTEVDSAFGGIAIYKLSSIPKECKYDGLHKNGMERCEHVTFNKCIKQNGGKIYINPYFLNDG